MCENYRNVRSWRSKFIDNIIHLYWSDVSTQRNPDTVFPELLVPVLDKHAPVNKMAPWIDDELK